MTGQDSTRRIVVCHGETGINHMMLMLAPDGLKRPYKVATMQEEWYEVAAHFGLPRYLFRQKLALMRFALGAHIVAVTIRHDNAETDAMAASLYAMGAVELNLHKTEDT